MRDNRECDVCVLVDGDHGVKQVGYCSLCNAWMCEACRSDTVRRAKAWKIRTMRGLRRGLGLDKVDGEVEDGQ